MIMYYRYFDRGYGEEVHPGNVDVLPRVHGGEESDERHPGDIPPDQQQPQHAVIMPRVRGPKEIPV